MKGNSCSLSYIINFFFFFCSLHSNFFDPKFLYFSSSVLDDELIERYVLNFLSIIRTSLSLSLFDLCNFQSHSELHFLFLFFFLVSLVETGRNNYFHFVLFSSFHHLLSASHLSFNFRTSEPRFFVSMDVVKFCPVWTTDIFPAIIVFLEFLFLCFSLIFHFLVPRRKAIFFTE